jgi:hypothetical protein
MTGTVFLTGTVFVVSAVRSASYESKRHATTPIAALLWNLRVCVAVNTWEVINTTPSGIPEAWQVHTFTHSAIGSIEDA